MNLSEKQRQIVEHVDGALLVKASPGSGKTRVIVERVKHLLSVLKMGKILVLTLGKVEADEMRSRIKEETEFGVAESRVLVGTMHSFCREIIQSRGHLIGLRPDVSLLENENDKVALLQRSIVDDPDICSSLIAQGEPAEFLSNALSQISEWKRSLVPPDAFVSNELLNAIYQRYEDVLRSQNALDFDDILIFAYRILTENIRDTKLYNSVYRCVCIDDAQDLNNAQYRVIQALCGTGFRNVMMVGNEKQPIHALNCSSSKYMSLFETDFQPTTYVLNENYRYAKRIVQFSNSLSTARSEDASRCVFEGDLSIEDYRDESEEAHAVFKSIRHLMENGHRDIENPLKHEDFAVIARNKYALSKIENELLSSNIPYHYRQTQKGIVSESDCMKVFDLALRLRANPNDLYHLDLLCRLLPQEVPTAPNRDKPMETLLGDTRYSWLISALELIPSEGIVDFVPVLRAIRDSLPQGFLADGDRYMFENDLAEWERHWERYEKLAAPEHRTLASFRFALSHGKTHETEGMSGVALITAPMSKGLEFEVVFVVGLAEGTFPDYRAVRRGGESLAQERNSMYIAVTRAKRLCFLSYPKKRLQPWGEVKHQSPSRYISQAFSQMAGQ